MENIFYEESLLFESAERRITDRMTKAIVSYIECFHENHYISESASETFWVKVKEFFSDMLVTFNTFYKNLKVKLKVTVSKVEFKSKMKKMEQDLKDHKDEGYKYVTAFDITKYKNTYLKMEKDLWSYVRKFEKFKYSSADQIDRDIISFEKLYKKYEIELDEISSKKIKVRIDDMLKLVGNEIDGESDVIKTIINTEAEIKEMQTCAESLRLRRDILGEDIIPKHVGFLKRLINRMTSFVKRHVVKFITAVVFVFA